MSRYFPVTSVDEIIRLASVHGFHLKISRGRASKLGDFRPSAKGRPHVITLNGDLNVHAGLLIFLHELAHLLVWEASGSRKSPHGTEWKQAFGGLIREFVAMGHFHRSLTDSLIAYSYKVKATGLGNEALMREMRMFDDEPHDHFLLEEIPMQSHFITRSGRMFRKEGQLRTRYKCFCFDNKRIYLFHPLARVKVMSNKD